jgi:integrase
MTRVVAWKPELGPGKWRVDIRFTKPDGTKIRNQVVHEAPTKGMAKRWGEAREAQMRAGSLNLEARQVLTVAEWAPDWITTLEGNGKKRSAIEAAQSVVDIHVLPFVGTRRLDRITDDVLDELKTTWTAGGYEIPRGAKAGTAVKPASKKSINNRLIVLRAMLRRAVRHKAKTGLVEMPCTFELLPVDDQRAPTFYDHETYERMVSAAETVSPEALVIVLLGGDAGLRLGEMLGLEWSDVDTRAGLITPRRSVYVKGEERHDDDVKGGKAVPVPMTPRLAKALTALRHLKGARVLYGTDGEPMTPKALRCLMARVEAATGLGKVGRVHVLRHTYVSHLAMAGVPIVTVKELARHADIGTTMRYAHLAPSAKDHGVAMLIRSRASGGTPVAFEAAAE